MAKIETYACDGCGIQKQPSNNWWKVFIAINDGPIGAVILQWDQDSILKPKEVGGGFTSERADAHICGSKCLLEWMSKHLLERTNQT